MSLQSEDYGKHLLSVQDLLEKHTLLEADIVTINERVKAINSQASKFIDQGLLTTSLALHVCTSVVPNMVFCLLFKHLWVHSCLA